MITINIINGIKYNSFAPLNKDIKNVPRYGTELYTRLNNTYTLGTLRVKAQNEFNIIKLDSQTLKRLKRSLLIYVKYKVNRIKLCIKAFGQQLRFIFNVGNFENSFKALKNKILKLIHLEKTLFNEK